MEIQAGSLPARLGVWIEDGIINPIFEIKANTSIDPLYEQDDL